MLVGWKLFDLGVLFSTSSVFCQETIFSLTCNVSASMPILAMYLMLDVDVSFTKIMCISMPHSTKCVFLRFSSK